MSEINFGDSIAKIGDSAFFSCDSLTSIEIPDTVTEIDNSAFMYCSNLSEVVIPNSVTKIGHRAFNGCPIYSVTLPASVAYIGNEAFGNKLTDLYYDGTQEEWNAIEIDQYAFPDSVTLHFRQ